MKNMLLFCLLFSFVHAGAQETKQFISPQIQTDTLWLPGTPVPFSKSLYGKTSRTVFINVHANETTSVEATKEYLADKSGLLLTLEHDTTRLVTFYYKTRLIQFDPNRIFSKKGRLANLKLLNRNAPVQIESIIGSFADALMKNMANAKIIIAMHNNTDGKPLTIHSFKIKYANPEMDEDDFILTTEKKIYDQLKQKKVNTVLQTQNTSTDDGSLAIYCSKKKIPYINIEAQQGHKEQQLQMLNALTTIISQYTQ